MIFVNLIRLTSIEHPKLLVDTESQNDAIQKLRLDAHKPAIALFPGAEYGPAKQWPLSYFETLANSLTKEGYQVWVMG